MKFVYNVHKGGEYFIRIYRFEDANLEQEKDEYSYYILEENELAEYVKKYPECCSLALDDDSEKEAIRLNEKYGLEMFGKD